jgi:hypothetical protein
MRRLVLKKGNRPPLVDWMSFFGGVTERSVALTLVLWAPAYLPTFIGGWVLLKFAIGWQRDRNEEGQEEGQLHPMPSAMLLPPIWKRDRQIAENFSN